MTSAISCGYARAAVLEAGQLTTGGDSGSRGLRRYNTYISLVGENSPLQITTTEFNSNGSKVLDKFKAWNRKGQSARDDRNKYLAYFSSKNWRSLTDNERRGHSLKLCKRCARDSEQSLFTNFCDSKRVRCALKDITQKSNIMSTPAHGNRTEIANQAYDNLR